MDASRSTVCAAIRRRGSPHARPPDVAVSATGGSTPPAAPPQQRNRKRMRYVEAALDDTHAQGTGNDRIWTLRPVGCPADEGRANPIRACFVGGFNDEGERVTGITCLHAAVDCE